MTAAGEQLHVVPEQTRARLRHLVDDFVADRGNPRRVGAVASPASLHGLLADAISPGGLGVERAWQLFGDVVSAHTFDLDGPRFLAFIPMAPSTVAVWMDAAVGAACFSAESWLEAAGAVAAENEALDAIRQWVRMPEGAGGAFCSGGSVGNLSALAVARDQRGRRLCVVADTAHASVERAAHLLGLEVVTVETGADGRLTGPLLKAALAAYPTEDVCVVVGSAGSTNGGVVDDLAELSAFAQDAGAWFHVDGAYGGAALLLDECRGLFAGVESADSFIVDPHKWLFSTPGSCALVYREPGLAVATHRQNGPYVDVLHEASATEEWNPSDYAFQLTRRPGGLPFWFTLAVHGTTAMTDAVRVACGLAQYAAQRIDALDVASTVMQPTLGVVLFRRSGWVAEDWRTWARDLAERQVAFVAPTTWKGEVVGRLVFLHPLTTTSVIDEVVDTLR